jgi:hypothetical protein
MNLGALQRIGGKISAQARIGVKKFCEFRKISFDDFRGGRYHAKRN